MITAEAVNVVGLFFLGIKVSRRSILSGRRVERERTKNIAFTAELESIRELVQPKHAGGFAGAFLKDLIKRFGSRRQVLLRGSSRQTELVASFERAASNYDVINSKTEYLVNTALVLARETVTPTFQPRGKSDNSALFLPGKLIPNVEYKFGGIIAGQFDGILVPTKYPGEEMDLLDYLENKQSWGVLEIKVPFRPRYISGERKIKKPFSWDVDQFRHRLGKLMVWWDKGHNTPFPLPSAVTFCYLRGVLPPVMHIQSINYHIFKIGARTG